MADVIEPPTNHFNSEDKVLDRVEDIGAVVRAGPSPWKIPAETDRKFDLHRTIWKQANF